MTARQIWEGMLTELSKTNAPSMLLQDFNYFLNKAINQYINKRYNIYDINQQTTDDLRVLKATSILDVRKSKNPIQDLVELNNSKLYEATYEVMLPLDYLHILNCICVYQVNKNWKCYNKGDIVQFAARRLTSDSWSVIINDYYNRPLPERPYFFIHNINVNQNIPTNPVNPITGTGTDMGYLKYGTAIEVPESKNVFPTVAEEMGGELKISNFPRTITLNRDDDRLSLDLVEKETAYRYGNASNVRMEIRYGCDNTVFELKKVFVDYIKTPQYIRLTQELVNLTEDTSLIMEFPDYVCQEIINELTMLVMENTADPRLLTNTIVTQSIANPAQQLTPQQQPQQRG